MRRLALACALGALLACIDFNGSAPGLLKVNLTTPNSGADRAIFLTVSSPAALMSVSPGTGLRLFSLPPPLGATNRFVLVGPLSTGTILTIGVPDAGRPSAYSATIQQVATPTYQLRPLAGYSLRLSR